MNRNEMYYILKDAGLVQHFIYRNKGKAYHVVYHDEDYKSLFIDFGCCYIRGACEIHLCMNEVVVVSKFGDAKINVKYSEMTDVVVREEIK